MSPGQELELVVWFREGGLSAKNHTLVHARRLDSILGKRVDDPGRVCRDRGERAGMFGRRDEGLGRLSVEQKSSPHRNVENTRRVYNPYRFRVRLEPSFRKRELSKFTHCQRKLEQDPL
uniref:Uncharacterized protein n=1 Tax=Candidatus Kentrum sp. FM TaxID=2126340 RepID=A0A450SJJ7_9GAMM|nr:MAG: hypothetical protein BECKFM1743A_GA0114220_1001811 [Candidatus Kentron sp. FM]VFJ53654.1 MAG: hypothetical protein BECKFM1743C_GA0114222_101272 [Candidatus Kentron sp. FM]VFK09878.1 MAG: hypothetical protein BECKFM1743B_GA0114221_101193 [Candidatus Kentron sp. FM]